MTGPTRRWAARLRRWVLLGLGLGLALLPAGAWAQKSPPLLHEEAALALPAPAAAVAISADESILAAAVPAGGGSWRVLLFDRPSRARLGVIVATVGREPRLRFSPVADLLLVAGSEALQLWELPLAPLDPKQPLAAEHRRWEVRPASGPAAVRFGMPPQDVYWSQGAALYRRSAEPGTAFDGTPFWQPPAAERADHALADFAFDPAGKRAVLVYRQRKELGLLDLEHGVLERTLEAHRFPVLAARYRAARTLESLDSGNNLVQWRRAERPVGTVYLDRVPAAFHAAGFLPLGERQLLLLAQDGQALVLDPGTGKRQGSVQGDGPQRIAVSATGRYVLAAEGRTLHLYGNAQPASPLDYVRHLRKLGAFTLAQSYVRLMDEHGLAPSLRTDLINEAGRAPPGQALEQAAARLRRAIAAGDTDRIRYWAERLLALQPDYPEAVAALRSLRTRQQARTLDQAREALAAGQNRVAISLLTEQIPPDSASYPEAQELIHEAEARRTVETALMQAREKLDLRDYVAAQALVQEVLRKEPDNRPAAALRDEIDDRSGVTGRQTVAATIGAALALLLVGLAFVRYRGRLGAALRPLRLDDEAPPELGPLGRAKPRVRETVRSGARARAATATATAERPPPRPGAGAARRKVVEALAKQVEERLQRLRQADVLGKLTARLMELEAELSAIVRRIADPTAELAPLHQRLRAIAAQVQKLRPENPRDSAAGREAGTGTQGRADPPHAADTNGEPTHYEVLKLNPDATPDQIRAAYHTLLKQYHPDLHNASQFDWVRAESERMSRRIAQAYQVLSDATARSRYDRALRARKEGTR